MRGGSRFAAIPALALLHCTQAAPLDERGRSCPSRSVRVVTHATPIALDACTQTLWITDADADAVVAVDVATRAVTATLDLSTAPFVDAAGHFAPSCAPRSIALSPVDAVAFVVCERSGEVVTIDTARRAVTSRRTLCARPVSVVANATDVFVACAADGTVLRMSPANLDLRARSAVSPMPWALALSADPSRILVGDFRDATVRTLDAATLATMVRSATPDVAPRGHRLLAHGVARGLADLAENPATHVAWGVHALYATDTTQPALDFESTVFPAVTAFGAQPVILSTDSRLEGVDGALAHVASGLHAVAFDPRGTTLYAVARNSENLLVLDTATLRERQSVDLPGAMPEGIAVAADGSTLYVFERNAGDVAMLRVAVDGSVSLDGAPVPVRARDPMPADLRAGQRVFHTSNDLAGAFPITTNRWIACESCHLDGATAGVTFRMAVGPRDVPSLEAGIDGFLMRTATRREVGDFWRTINVEQGGHFRADDAVLGPSLAALAAYVTRGIAAPVRPAVDGELAAQGRAIFESTEAGCATCHTGARRTDSGAGNASLDLAGTVVLHDVGTCAADDVAHTDIAGNARAPCAFDTPALAGLAASAPYLHDGSAATLGDVITTRNAGDRHGRTSQLDEAGRRALVEFLRGL